MAVGMLMVVPQVDATAYDQVMTAMDWDTTSPPEGLIADYAGPGPDGWTVFDIWESQGHFQKFAQTQLGAAMQQVMGQVPEISPTFVPIHNQFTAAEATV